MRNIVISLPTAAERRALIEREFNRHQISFQFYDAIDGATLSEEQKSLVDYSALRREARYFPLPGAIAVWLTQMEVFRNFVNSNEALLAVFQDDVRLNQGAKTVLKALTEDMKCFDIVKLSWRQKKRKFLKCVNLIANYSVGIIDGYDTGADAFVISKDAARHLVESHPKMCWHLDHLITRYWENGLTVGIVYPPVAYDDHSLKSQISESSYSRKVKSGIDFKYPRYPIWRREFARFRANVRMRKAVSRIIAEHKDVW